MKTKKWRWGIVVVILVALLAIVFTARKKQGVDSFQDVKTMLGRYPKCPSDLSGILTFPLMMPEDISALTPLGNLNPPGHTSPVDHIYFASTRSDKVPVYAPADARITNITEILFQESNGEYVPTRYTLTFTICDGLTVVFANYTELTPTMQAEFAKLSKKDCKFGIKKDGHEKTEGQCYYSLKYPVKAGDLIGWTQNPEGGELPFEIWAYNYMQPSRTDIDRAYYQEDINYMHSFCLFDLYTGELKDQFYSKFGRREGGKKLGEVAGFTPRTMEPRCGQINQDVVGTIQGMWFDSITPDRDIEEKGKGLAIVHDNIDPRQVVFSIGGNFMKVETIYITPTHAGLIDREPSEVRADGNIYCYNNSRTQGSADADKILVQLIDDHQMKVEHQIGICGTSEAFQKPFTYRR